MEFWKNKLAAYLHDPPEKAYDYGPAHQAAAEKHAASFGVAERWKSLTHHPDWSAAANGAATAKTRRKRPLTSVRPREYHYGAVMSHRTTPAQRRTTHRVHDLEP